MRANGMRQICTTHGHENVAQNEGDCRDVPCLSKLYGVNIGMCLGRAQARSSDEI
jgi:hypothetical protein